MGDSEDLRHLRSILQQAIKACKLPVRQIEEALGVGHGSLDKLFDGTIELRVRHILACARLLDVPPQDFLELACPPPEDGTKYRLRDWITPRELGPPQAERKIDGAEGDLAALIRKAVREELGADLRKTIRAVLREERAPSDTEPARSEK